MELWFNLISYNGSCWQTFGPICHFLGFQAGDIHFFTSVLQTPQAWLDRQEIMSYVEKNPVPFFFLMTSANVPLVYYKRDQMIGMKAEYDYEILKLDEIGDSMIIEEKKGIFRLRLKGWDGPPHFSSAYFDEKNKILTLHALTEAGYDQLITRLNQYGYELSPIPDYRVNMSMLATASNILKKEVKLDEHEHLFEPKITTKDQGVLDELNQLMEILTPEIDAGRTPDVAAISKQTGIDPRTINDLTAHLLKSAGRNN